MKRVLVFGLMLMVLTGLAKEKVGLPFGKNELLLQGFKEKISGTDFRYHSSIPDVNDAMIVRVTNGKQAMEWATEEVPQDISSDFVSFVWLAGVGCNVGHFPLDLYVNGEKKFQFYTDKRKNWEMKAEDGTQLIFRHNMYDRANDQFGFMFLRVPKRLLKTGASLKLKVIGSNSNSSAWYMTFKTELEPGISFKAFPAVYKENGIEKQAIAANVYHFGSPVSAKIYADGKLYRKVKLNFGHNYFRLGWPVVEQGQKIDFKLEAGNFTDETEVALQPVRKWQVNFVQHSHTDIGYTRAQTEILAEHLRYIDYALDYCDATDDYPELSKFRWTCEAAWAVDEYLKSRPQEQIDRLKKRIKEGRIELTGMYFNFDELPDEQTLAASLAPLKRFKENGLPVKVAMQNDVNGIGWCFADYFPEMGIRYLNMGTHGHRALICFDYPTAFWWESPSGNRMLAFRAEHYMTGNTEFGIHTNNFEQFEDKLMGYLLNLENKGYPYDLIAIQHSGYLTDNAPPSTLASEMIKKWNEKYNWPKLKSAVSSEYFEKIEAEHADNLPVYRAAWPDWWTDGFASGAREVSASRQAHVDVIAAQGALSLAKVMGSKLPKGITERVAETNKSILFYDEHTFGSAESVRDPYGQSTMEQRALKESYAWEAFRRARMVNEEAMGLLQSHVSKEDVPSLVVFNTLNWKREGLITAYIDHQILPHGHEFRFVDGNGNIAPAQALAHRSDGTYWGIWVKDVPSFGYKKYRIEVSDKDKVHQKEEGKDSGVVENDWYRINIDLEKGVVTSLFDKQLNKELVDQKAGWKLGEFIYERLGNRSQMEGYKMDDYQRYSLDAISFEEYHPGAVWNTIRFKGSSEMCCYGEDGFAFEIRIFNTTKRIDFNYTVRKKPVIEPEGIYIAFPFDLEGGKIYADVPGGVMEAGVDQLPGSSNDWNTVQNFATVRNGSAQIVIGSHETPLMQFGGINTGRYKAGAKPANNHIMGWPMNNYWVTNFNADQRGIFTWNYYLTSAENNHLDVANRFAWDARIPMPARVLPAGKKSDGVYQNSVMSGIPENVLVVNTQAIEGENTIILQLRETAGKATVVQPEFTSGKQLKIVRVNVVKEPVGKSISSIKLKSFETAFYKVSW